MNALLNFDWTIFQRIHAWGTWNSATEHIFYFLNYAAVVVLLLYIAAYVWRHRARTAGVVILASGAAAYLVSRFIGFLYFRPRPFVTHNFEPLISASALSKSFPSSHAIVAFALAFALYKYNKKWGRWALVIAAIIALLRVIVGVHYPSDVLAGAAFGVLTSWLIRKFI